MTTEILQIGGVALLRAYCGFCEEYVLLEPDAPECPHCNTPIIQKKKRAVRTIAAPQRRRKPNFRTQDRILREQTQKCYWCGRSFGSKVNYNNELIELKAEFDHVIPYAYCSHNGKENFVAACQLCNHWKGAKVFQTEDEIAEYLWEKWNEAGYL
jgi:5-methylcytosine-specific restriction endonuclease McrA